MLKIDKIRCGYSRQKDILQELSLNIPQGELTAVIGPNGSGKSTLLKAIAGGLPLKQGDVFFEGRSIRAYKTRELARQMAFLTQSPSAPSDYTVRDLVSYGRFPHLAWSGKMTRHDWHIVAEALELTHLTSLAQRPISRLSGGERQRAWIAMALAQKPRLLILDEPTTHLDISFQYEVLELVKHLNMTLDITTLIVLHDLNQAARFADRIVVLKDGQVVQNDRPEAIFDEQQLEDIFHIRVGIEEDRYNQCPMLIPIASTRQIGSGQHK